MKNFLSFPVAVLALLALGCGSKASAPAAAIIADVPPSDLSAQPDTAAAYPTGRDVHSLRTVVHIHSVFSHDACDNWITDHDGDVNQTCIAQLRASLCASGLDVAFMTDHPARMKEHSFDELLFIDTKKGDVPVLKDGAPIANRIQCPAGDGLPAHEVQVMVGYETTHTMPVGLYRHYTNTAWEGQADTNDVPFADARAGVDGAHAVGGVVVNAHSEEDSISAQRLVDVGVDAMEIYNLHANFLTITGQGSSGLKPNIGRILKLESFLGDAASSPVSDLALLVMLDIQPEAAFKKWQAVLGQRHVTGLLGNDVHQNVVLPQICAPDSQYAGVCDGLTDTYPHLTKLLTEGGKVMLADGKRIDDYTRMLRWVQDRAVVPAGTPLAERAEAVKLAILQGRIWAEFDVLGIPDGADFYGDDGKQWLEMGAKLAKGQKLWVHTPTLALAPWSSWTLADAHKPGDETSVRTIVWRIAPGADHAEIVTEIAGMGQTQSLVADQPGRYHIEVRIKPKHLRAGLKGLGDLADMEQRWTVSNPIEVQ